ncbi:MAG: CvpA family protein [Desulfuromonadales bacterium]|nr:CvpA family protein [Desulfuromonadales bacterium]MDW7757070.1 CvpA family protein [Desulfuromonadales bacterium]
MNIVDIAILVILAGFTLKGLLRGLLKELCSLLGLVTGALFALYFHAPLAELLVESFRFPLKLAVGIAYVVLFVVCLLFFALLGYLLSRFVKLVFLGGVNRVAGGFFGLMQGGVLLAIGLFALSIGPLPATLGPMLKGSQLAPPFVRLGQVVFEESRDFYSSRS